jgi:hypothetical protein
VSYLLVHTARDAQADVDRLRESAGYRADHDGRLGR